MQKRGSINKARELFDRIPDRELFDRIPGKDVISWTAAIAGYVLNGCVEKASTTLVWRGSNLI